MYQKEKEDCFYQTCCRWLLVTLCSHARPTSPSCPAAVVISTHLLSLRRQGSSSSSVSSAATAINAKLGTGFSYATSPGGTGYYAIYGTTTSSTCNSYVKLLNAAMNPLPQDICLSNATNLNAQFPNYTAAGACGEADAAIPGTCSAGYTSMSGAVEAKCCKGQQASQYGTWQATSTSGQCLKPAPQGTPCRVDLKPNGTATCNKITYDFSKIRPPDGSKYFTAKVGSNDTLYFDMVGDGLNASTPGCSFQKDYTEGNVGGLAVGASDLCFSVGKVEKQKWYLNGTSDPLNQVVSVVFRGGQNDVETRLEVTCDPSQEEPFFPSTLPAQADLNVIVIPVRSKYACSSKAVRPPSIDGLPYCLETCSKDWEKCVAKDTSYSARQCLDFANKGFLCKSDSIPTKCDATGFLKKTPLCPGQMRFVSCIACRPTCQTPSPTSCSGDCAPGCKCPLETPYWDAAVGSCVAELDCPRTGDCDQAIVQNYLGMPIASSFCPSRAQGAICNPTCEHNLCVPRPSFDSRDKYAPLCAQLDKKECGARKNYFSSTPWSHRCIWADPTSGTNPAFECNGGSWELVDPGSCPIGSGESSGVVGPACRALSASQCIAEANCTATAKDQCGAEVQRIAGKCKFPCIAVESGSKANMERCARCVYTEFQATYSANRSALQLRSNQRPGGGGGGGALAGTNVTDIQTCCGCLPSLFASLPGGFIPTDVLPTVMQSPCMLHDPLQDDDWNMDDDAVNNDK